MTFNKHFKNFKEFATFVESPELGGTAYFVGGCIRNEILELPRKDVDICLTNILKESFDKLFNKVGKDFPVYLVMIDNEMIEVALARRERKTGEGYNDFSCEVENVTIEEDLSRRDFTMNSLAKNILTGEVIDPFNGLNDINNGILKHVSKAFSEDPLRVYRAFRFMAQYNFELDEETSDLIRGMKSSLYYLSVERVFTEMKKAVEARHTRNFFDGLMKHELLHVHFEEVQNLNVADKHDGTSYNHTMNLLEKTTSDFKIKFGILCHDFGKGKTPKEELPSHLGHAKRGVKEVENFCKRLKIDSKMTEFAKKCSELHMKLKMFDEMSKKGKLFKFLLSIKKDFSDLMNVTTIDSIERNDVSIQKKKACIENHCLALNLFKAAEKSEKTITGKDFIKVGIEEGKKLGMMLEQTRIRMFMKLIKNK